MKSRVQPTRSYKAAKAALRGKPTRKQEREARKKARAQAWADIRYLVLMRACCGGYLTTPRCENPDCNAPTLYPEYDHFLGGSGRRRAMESVETVWLLDPDCHRLRTESVPSAKVWNDRFEMHARRYGYPVLRHLEREPVRGRR